MVYLGCYSEHVRKGERQRSERIGWKGFRLRYKRCLNRTRGKESRGEWGVWDEEILRVEGLRYVMLGFVV